MLLWPLSVSLCLLEFHTVEEERIAGSLHLLLIHLNADLKKANQEVCLQNNWIYFKGCLFPCICGICTEDD